MGMLSEFLGFLFVLSLLGLLLYHRAYSEQKGKNKALHEDINRITEESEKVKHKYSKEIEDVKAMYALDIEKRKHQYVAKLEIYKKFFALIDEFHKRSNDSMQKEFLPILSAFQDKHLEASAASNKEKELAATVQFSENVMAFTFKMHEESLRLKSETNAIRLIATEVIAQKIDKMEALLDKSFDSATAIMNKMCSIEFQADQTIIQPLLEEARVDGVEIKNTRDEIMKLMKVDLDKI